MHKQRFSLRFSLIAALGLLLVACATTTDLQKAQEGGATALSQKEIVDLWVGNSLKSVDGRWVVYYREDGAKLLRHSDGTDQAKWRVSDAGEFCEELFSNKKKEACGPTVTVQGGVYTSYRPDGSASRSGSYRLLPGNPEGL